MRRLGLPAVLAAFAVVAFVITGCSGGSDTDPGVATWVFGQGNTLGFIRGTVYETWVFGQGNTLGFIRGTVYDENSLTGVSARVLANDIGVPTFQDGRYVIDPTPCNGRVLMSAGSGRHRARSVEIDSSNVNLYLEPQPENPTGLVTVNVTVHGAQVQNVAVYVGWNTPDTPDGTVQVVAGRAVGLVRVEPNRRYTVSAWAPGKVMDFITDLDVREGNPVEVNLDLYDATSTNSGSINPRGFPTNATVGAIAIGVGNMVDVVSSTLRDVGSLTTFNGLPPGTYWVWAAADSHYIQRSSARHLLGMGSGGLDTGCLPQRAGGGWRGPAHVRVYEEPAFALAFWHRRHIIVIRARIERVCNRRAHQCRQPELPDLHPAAATPVPAPQQYVQRSNAQVRLGPCSGCRCLRG